MMRDQGQGTKMKEASCLNRMLQMLVHLHREGQPADKEIGQQSQGNKCVLSHPRVELDMEVNQV